MKKITLLLFLFIVVYQGFSQCEINPYIQENYELDAKILALREIIDNSMDPDYNNPFLPEERYIPYLERLSALYENPLNSPVVDSIFNEFNFHVNQEYNFPIEYKRITLEVANSVPWQQDFKDTGVSGLAALDTLMAEYQFYIVDYWELSSSTYFFLETNFAFLNMYALVDDFEGITDIEMAEVGPPDINLRFNYTGIPYSIQNEPVSTCDIDVSGDYFFFILYAGDCFSGCMYYEYRTAEVTQDCEVLSSPTNEFQNFALYPNPTSDKVYLNGISAELKSVEIYSIEGKLLQSLKNPSSEIDLSFLNMGTYFFKVVSAEGNTIFKKIIKK